ncbi:nuclear transport factor 2 family protein [Acaryochloris sp. CCMEE 5410]|uniref:YybH family protein n=1 Tax=Acaryochloris sp. CCMEE 5410 TaxID=310037 RepID=UPI000248393F|nr:nuclear transport factor 2 family protein [Acaryochloris sp. CCMEE 5410]KAI9134699.1 nuclear transport factor 2 family protein [Acaryochloris sp. CCMEE 5410]
MTLPTLEEFEQFLRQYNQCFYDRNLAALRNLYVDDGQITYFDNHAGCDATDLDHHLQQVSQFFATGTIVELVTEGMHVFQVGEAACVIAKVRYSNQPRPGVRSTFFLERDQHAWKIRHIHFSTDPNELE